MRSEDSVRLREVRLLLEQKAHKTKKKQININYINLKYVRYEAVVHVWLKNIDSYCTDAEMVDLS